MTQLVGDKVQLNNGQTVTPQIGGWYDARQYWGNTLSNPGEFNSQNNLPGQQGRADRSPENDTYIRNLQANPNYNPTPNNTSSPTQTFGPADFPLPESSLPKSTSQLNFSNPEQTPSATVRPINPVNSQDVFANSASVNPFTQLKGVTPVNPSFTPLKQNTEQGTSTIPKPKPEIPDWIWNQIVEGAQKAAKKYGIPASVTLAQFMQETGGHPKNFIGGTNIFGIKGSGNAGSATLPTLEYDNNGNPYHTNSTFAKYGSIADAMEAHAKLLTQNPAYSKIQQFIEKGNFNPQDYTRALQGTYATNPKYAANLNNLIAMYGFNHADDYASYPTSRTMLGEKLGR